MVMGPITLYTRRQVATKQIRENIPKMESVRILLPLYGSEDPYPLLEAKAP